MSNNKLGETLWNIANKLRGQMDSDRQKDYILAFIFLKFLSNQYQELATKILADEEEGKQNIQDLYNSTDKELIQDFEESIQEDLGYTLKPNHLWSYIHKNSKTQSVVENLQEVFQHLSKIANQETSQEHKFDLFESVDLHSSNLGTNNKEREKTIITIIEELETALGEKNINQDELGDAYEYLISKFASSSGKKAGEFYTPNSVAKILAKIVTLQHADSTKKRDKIKKVYDPTCGSGSLLCTVYNEMKPNIVQKIYGQEKNHTTYNLSRMNLFLHKVKYQDFDIALGDTLTDSRFKQENKDSFDCIVANPPFSLQWEPDKIKEEDERFASYQKPPKSTADLAFVIHCLSLLSNDGTLSIILPHGVLFRGNKEKEIREKIINQNTNGYLDAVIGLAPNLFFSTSIPVCILVFKKCRKDKDIFFIDASKEFQKDKNQNTLTEENIAKIITTYQNRQDIDKFAKNISKQEIEKNDYNLNITRYIDNTKKEEEIDINQEVQDIKNLTKEEQEINQSIEKYCQELGLKTPW